MITTQDLAQAILELKLSQAETDEQMKRTDEQMKKTDEKLERMGITLGNTLNNQGDVAEEFFINSISPTLKVAGIQYDQLHKNWHKRTKKAEGEFDIVLINGKDIAIIETKYKAHENDLDDLINKKHKNFKKLYPQYDDYTHHLGLASFYINDDTKEKALNNNVMILQRKGELVETFLPNNTI